MSVIKVTYKNKETEYDRGILVSEIAEKVKEDYKYDILASTAKHR